MAEPHTQPDRRAPGTSDSLFIAGAIVILFAGFLWSLQGVTIRWIEDATAGQIVFWRHIGQLSTFLLILFLQHRTGVVQAFRRAGKPALLGGLCQVISSICIIYAFLNTTVANVVFIISFAPFVAAVVAWIFLRERLEGRTWLAMSVGTIGVGIMVAEGLAGGLFAGNLLAFVATFSFAALTAIYRWRRHVDMIPTLCWSSTIGVLAGLVISGGVVTVSGHDLALCLFMGCIYNAVGGFLYVRASRYVPAGLLAFLSLSEIVLAPIWAWLGAGEVPTGLTLVGGAIVLGAVLSQPLARARRTR